MQGLLADALPGFAPDLTLLGKVVGGGMPLAAFGGRRDIMEQLSPLGGVYQAGTLSGNPLATACGLATLNQIAQPDFFENLTQKTNTLQQGLTQMAAQYGIPWSSDQQGGMFGFFLLDTLPQNYAQVMQSDAALFSRFFHGLLNKGIYIAPALYEAGFVSSAHTLQDIETTIQAAGEVFATLI